MGNNPNVVRRWALLVGALVLLNSFAWGEYNLGSYESPPRD